MSKRRIPAPAIRFKTKLYKIGSWTLLTLPGSASAKLPSRGMVMVEGTINGYFFRAALEPDGRGSHWLRVDKTPLNAVGLDAGERVTVTIMPAGEWLEPDVPEDLKDALTTDPQARNQWMEVTPMARWFAHVSKLYYS